MLTSTRRTWLIILFTAAIIFAAAFVGLSGSINQINQSVVDLQLGVAERVASEINIFVDSRENLLGGLSNIITSVDPASQDIVLRRFLSEEKDFKRISVADGRGFEQYRFVRSFNQIFEESPENLVLTQQYWQTLGGQTYLGLVSISEEDTPVMSIAVPIIDSVNRNVIGSINADLELRSIWKLSANITTKSGGKVYIVDHLGRLVADPDLSLVLRGDTRIERPIVRKIIEEKAIVSGFEEQYRYKNEKGVDSVASGVPINKLGWAAVVEEPEKQVLLAATRVKQLGGIFIGVSLILFFVVLLNLKNINRLIVKLDLERKHNLLIVTNLVDGVIEYTNDFNVKTVNSALEKMLGIKAEEVIGRTFHPEDSNDIKFSSLVKVLFPVLSSVSHTVEAVRGKPKVIEISINHPIERDLQIVIAPIIDENGKLQSYLKIVRDISREKVIERNKSEFLSLAAHQLRTPLSAIKWIFRMFLDGDIGKLNDEQTNLMQKGYDSNERMVVLVNDLLDVTRIEEGRFGYKFIWSDLTKIVADETDKFLILAKKKGLNMIYHRPEKDLSKIKLDPEKIQMVLNNLLDNSVQYTLPGGSIEVGLKQENNFAKVWVRDSGMGISDADKNKLFNKFFRGANVIRKQTDGTGLGLFIAKNIINNHGGKIWAESQENKGTVFYFTIPFEESMIPNNENGF